jgi:autotransporter-associated beta strand protein
MFSFCRRHLPFVLFPLIGSRLLAADLVWTAANPANTVWTAAGVWNGPATWVNGDSASFTASATVNLGSAISQTGVSIAAGSLLTLNNTADIKITGAGGFSGALIKTGATTLRLSHSSGFNGTLTVGNQFVVLGSAATDPTGQTSNQTKVVINSGAGLILGSAYNLGTATIGELSGAGAVRTDWADGGTNANRNLKVDQSSNSVFSGTFVQGNSNRTIGLEKAGAGTLDISNNAALTVPQGGITVSGGILKISGNIVISGTANSGFTGTWKATSGTIGFLSETSMGGSTNISLDGGGLFLNANGAGISATKTITLGAGDGNFDGATGWTQTWSAKITGSGDLIKRSGMVLVLDGASNDYTGATNIQSGTLKLGAANAVASSSQIIVGASTTLDVSAVAWTLGASQILSGTGIVLGNAAIDGTLATGTSAGTMTITGDVGLGSGSDWQVEIGGTATSAFDRLLVSGELTAGGTISLALINGFNPSVSNSFQIATFTSFVDNSYTFDFSGASLAPGLSWDTSGFASSGVIAVVPEPGFAFLGSIGFLLILRRRR